MSEESRVPGQAFRMVADAYDRARPSYPDEAVSWLTGHGRSLVLELGAGSGRLTEVLHRQGHRVVALDALPEQLRVLRARVPVAHVAGAAEHLPLPSRSMDLVACGQAFQWFDAAAALQEAARVLRPGGVIALAWNTYDTSIPWVRRLKALISPEGAVDSLDTRTMPLLSTPYFGFVEQRRFRFWQTHTAASLLDLARSMHHVATMREPQRETLLRQVAALYDDFERGHDGMQLPWVTCCFRAVVRHQELPSEQPPPAGHSSGAVAAPDGRGAPPEDPGTRLIDFR